MKRKTLKQLAGLTALAALSLLGTAAQAQTKLKWAHVYEVERAVSHAGAVGRRGDQEAHQRHAT